MSRAQTLERGLGSAVVAIENQPLGPQTANLKGQQLNGVGGCQWTTRRLSYDVPPRVQWLYSVN